MVPVQAGGIHGKDMPTGAPGTTGQGVAAAADGAAAVSRIPPNAVRLAALAGASERNSRRDIRRDPLRFNHTPPFYIHAAQPTP